MKKLFPLAAVVLILACGGGEPAPQTGSEPSDDPAADPHELFMAVNEAVLEVNAVEYDFTVEGVNVTDVTEEYSSTGRAVLSRGTSIDDAMIRMEFTSVSSGVEEQAVVVSNEDYAAYLNESRGNYIYGLMEDGGAYIVHQNGFPQGAVIREYLYPEEPFGAELNAPGYAELDPGEIDGIPCRVIAVDMSPYESTWWIDTETGLPMANRISYWNQDGTGMEYMISLSSVDTSIDPDPSVFELECPSGIEPQQVRGSIPQGSAAPDWTLQSSDGTTVSLSDLRGRVVVMDFWATWCMPCRQVMPMLQELHETYGEELYVVGVNVWEQADDPTGFVRDMGITYPVLLNGDDVAVEYIVEGIPTFYVIAPDGTVAFHAVGSDPANEEALREVVGTLLAQ